MRSTCLFVDSHVQRTNHIRRTELVHCAILGGNRIHSSLLYKSNVCGMNILNSVQLRDVNISGCVHLKGGFYQRVWLTGRVCWSDGLKDVHLWEQIP